MKIRVIASIAAILLGVCLLAGCGSKKAMNTDEVSSRLLKEITYQDSLSPMDLDTAGMFLNLSGIDVKSAAIYESSGWTAEEIIVMECASSADADKAKAMMEARVSEQQTNFMDYVPEEMDKLNAAVIVESGNFAVLSVSDEPEKARSLLSEYE